MGKAKFNLEHKEILGPFVLEITDVVFGKIFGILITSYLAYYINKKLFAFFYD
ncbi:MAG: hypothetical protein Q7V10_00775 [Methanobacteriaceae archaeon]|jgi:hypothetical protein|nr:hypothetical protein [Methanobacteriaceae archaeon]MDO9628006.1 hypothetical protein [Methanobacteriaceae archaeon]